MEWLIYLSVLLPIFGAPVIWFVSHYTNKWFSWYLSLAVTGFSALIALLTVLQVASGARFEHSLPGLSLAG